ncbi:hypothetical protein FRC02_000189, partial [Tulasnella sp. 418]
MEIFGTVASSVDLALKVKATFEQVGQNRVDCAELSNQIVDSLSQIREWLEHRSLSPPTELRDDITEFENELRNILNRQKRLTESSKDGILGNSRIKFKELYNADDIKLEIVELHRKVQRCYQNLQASSTVRTESRVAIMYEEMVAIREEQEASTRQLQNQIQILMDELIPGSTLRRKATLEQIHVKMQQQERPSPIVPERHARQQSIGIQAAPSIKSAKFSLRSLSTSFIEKSYLKGKVKEIATTIPLVRDQAFKNRSISLFSPFRDLEKTSLSTFSREDSIRETLRILMVLRSGKKIPYTEAVNDLLCLARALGHLGMHEEASEIYDWGVQICCELAKISGPKTLFDLARFLHKLSADLERSGLLDDGRVVLEQAIKVRRQLEEQDQKTYILKLATSLNQLSDQLSKAEHFGASVKALQEVANIYRNLIKTDRQTYIPNLGLALHNLALDLSKAERDEDAMKIGEEAVKIRRELARGDRWTHLPDLASSLHNLSVTFAKLERYEDAVKTGQEVVAMRRQLVQGNRRANIQDLNAALVHLSSCLHEIGRQEEAAKMLREAYGIPDEYWESQIRANSTKLSVPLLPGMIGAPRSPVSDPGMDLSSDSQSEAVRRRKQHEEAIKAGEKAVKQDEELVSKDRGANLPRLVISLHDLAIELGNA